MTGRAFVESHACPFKPGSLLRDFGRSPRQGVEQPRLPRPPGMLEPAMRAFRMGEDVGKLVETCHVDFDPG